MGVFKAFDGTFNHIVDHYLNSMIHIMGNRFPIQKSNSTWEQVQNLRVSSKIQPTTFLLLLSKSLCFQPVMRVTEADLSGILMLPAMTRIVDWEPWIWSGSWVKHSSFCQNTSPVAIAGPVNRKIQRTAKDNYTPMSWDQYLPQTIQFGLNDCLASKICTRIQPRGTSITRHMGRK